MDKIKRLLTIWISSLLFGLQAIYAQAGSKPYSFLSLPPSSHIAALGGTNISIQDNDISLALQNPALLSEKTHLNLGLNATNYVSDIFFGSAVIGYNLNEKQFFGLGIHFVDYGDFLETTEQNQIIGEFTAKDMAFHLMYAHKISPEITVGGTLKPIYSAYQDYNSFALAADLGLSYHKESALLSMGLVLKNVGFQFKGFYKDEDGDQYRENLPIELQFGMSKKLKNAPFRFSITLTDLQKFDLGYRWNKKIGSLQGSAYAIENEDINFFDNCMRHILFGVDFLPSDKFYLTASYNYRRAKEMKVLENKSMAGFSFGGGFNLYKFRIGFAYSQLHPKEPSYSFSLVTNLQSFGLKL